MAVFKDVHWWMYFCIGTTQYGLYHCHWKLLSYHICIVDMALFNETKSLLIIHVKHKMFLVCSFLNVFTQCANYEPF